MSKKYKRKQKRKFKKVSPDEVYNYGPIRLERLGRHVGISSNWAPGEFEKHKARVRANKEPFRNEINQRVAELRTVISEFDPLDLLSHLSFKNVFANPETFTESTHKGRESYVEYALSLALSIEKPNFGVQATETALERFGALIKEIFNDLGWFFAIERLDSDDETRNEIRYLSLMRYLNVRGDAYPEHHLDLIRELFSPHDDFLQNHYGFTTENIIRWTESIEKQILDSLHDQLNFFAKLHEMHEIYKKFVAEKGIDSFATLDDCLREFDALPELQPKKRAFETLHEKIDRKLFQIRPNNELPPEFVDLISAGFGENTEFGTFEKSPGWPTNDSVIYRRPIVKNEDDYYCFCPQIIFRNLISIIEGFIRDKDENYFQNNYQKNRARYLVRQALRYFQDLLPGATVYEGLFYPDPGGEASRAETDGLILFDTNLLVLEGKAGSLTVPARRGALSRLERHIKDLVNDAYEQGLRTKRYIEAVPQPRFEYENGGEALIIDKKGDFRNIYLLNVTLENLGHLSTRLVDLKKLNFIRGKEWPWSVALTDLRIISEVSDSPSEFLLYLQRRIKVNEHPEFHSADELDYFMYYLRDGLYFDDDRLKGLGVFGLHAYTERLDRWYDFQAGRVSSGEKPRLDIPEDYKTLIRAIEANAKPRFSEVTTALLGFEVETMEVILENIERGKELIRNDGKQHDLTLEFGHTSLGLTIVISPDALSSLRWGTGYCLMRKYQLKFSRWILLTVDASAAGNNYDFRFYDAPWGYDAKKEAEVSTYRQKKLEKYLASFGKPGRNDPCPCNSTLKYKKCCGRTS